MGSVVTRLDEKIGNEERVMQYRQLVYCHWLFLNTVFQYYKKVHFSISGYHM